MKRSDVVPVYIYFDLKNATTTTQTAYNVAACLLKQIVWPPDKDCTYLKTIYDEINVNADRPTQDAMVKMFIQCAKSLNVRVLFDALDECRDDELGKIFQLIEKFREANIGVYITTRPHIVSLLKERKRLADAVYMENIMAHEADTAEFLRCEIQSHRVQIESEFMNEIVRTIGNGEGMYYCLD